MLARRENHQVARRKGGREDQCGCRRGLSDEFASGFRSTCAVPALQPRPESSVTRLQMQPDVSEFEFCPYCLCISDIGEVV